MTFNRANFDKVVGIFDEHPEYWLTGTLFNGQCSCFLGMCFRVHHNLVGVSWCDWPKEIALLKLDQFYKTAYDFLGIRSDDLDVAEVNDRAASWKELRTDLIALVGDVL